MISCILPSLVVVNQEAIGAESLVYSWNLERSTGWSYLRNNQLSKILVTEELVDTNLLHPPLT